MAVADIIITPCKVYYSATGATLVADTVAAGGAWPAGWTALGYTLVPLSIELKRDPAIADIQESLNEIVRGFKKEALTAETTLAELTGAQLALVMSGTLSQTAAGASQPAKDELIGGDVTSATERQWGFEGAYVNASGTACFIRFYIWKGVAEMGSKLEFGKSDPTGTTLRVVGNPDMTKAAGQRVWKLVKMTAAASS